MVIRMRFCTSLSVVTLLSVVSAFVPESDWVCGAATFDQSLSFQRASEVCNDVGFDVNQCCIIHDKCYEENKTQVECDDPFCACLEKQTYLANSTDCGVVLEGFCSLVKLFGGIAHAGAKAKTTSSTMATTKTPKISIETCFRENLQSCTRDFEACSTLPGTDIHQCEEQMCACTQASLYDSAPQQCQKIINRVCATPNNHRVTQKVEKISMISTVSIILVITATTIILSLAIVVLWISIRMHLRAERYIYFTHSSSTTPLCASVRKESNFEYAPGSPFFQSNVTFCP